MAAKDFSSPEDLAQLSTGKTGIILVIGSRQQCDPLVAELERLISPTEQIMHIEQDSRLFKAVEKPKSFPAIGVWSSKGTLVGYREPDESISDFLDYARRYC